jgi:putative hydrolase of the HAD superfamily
MAEQPIPGGAPRAVLLDAMGTLLTFEPPAPLLRAALRERLGVDVGEDAARAAIRAEIAFYRAHIHLGRDAASLDALRRASAEAMRPALAAAAGAPGEVLVAALLAALRFRAFPDAAPALRALRAAGLALVVVSNWDASLHERLEETGIAPLVDGAVASAPFGAAKPDPAIFARGLELAGGAPAAAAWHVGDSPDADVAGARAAGLRAVLLDRDGGAAAGDPPAGTPVIASLTALPAAIGVRADEYPARSRR